MQKDKAFQVGAIIERFTNRLLAHVSEEELQRAHLLLVTGLILGGGGALFLVVQLTSFAFPSLPNTPWTDIALDIVTLLAGGLILWLTRAGRVQLAACVVLGCLLAIGAAHLYLEGRPPFDIGGAFILLATVVLGMVLLGRFGAWLAFAAACVAYLSMNLLWMNGRLPQPTARELPDQAEFAIISWVATSLIILVAVDVTMGTLRRRSETLKQRMAEYEKAEKARQESERILQEYTQRLEALRDIDQAISEARSSKEIARAAIHHIRQMIPCQGAHVMLFDFEKGEATMLASSINNTLHFEEKRQLPLQWFSPLEDLKQRGVHILDDISTIAQPTPAEQAMQAQGFRSHLSVALVAGGDLIGALNLGSATPGAFDAEQVEVARQVANQLAVALQQAHLFEAEKVARQQAETLRHVAGVLSASVDRQQVLQLILDQLNLVVDYDSASIQLLRGEQLVVKAVFGVSSSEELVGYAFDIADDVLVHPVLKQGQTIVLGDVRQHGGWIDPTPEMEHVRSWIAAPLTAHGRCFGILTVDSRQVDHYNQTDAQLVSAFASHAAVAIENARLFEQIQRQAAEMEERVRQRTAELSKIVNLMAGREVRMAELKKVIRKLRAQLNEAGLEPVADDPLLTGEEE